MPDPIQHIVVTDLRIPFTRLVMFFVKVALAAIPAAIIVGLIVMLISAVLTVLFGSNSQFMIRRWGP